MGKLGIACGCAAVGAVADREGNSPRLQPGNHVHKPVVLEEGIVPAGALRLVGHGEVGEHALNIQSRQGADSDQSLQGGVKMCLVALEAQPGHTGVQLNVGLHLSAGLYRSVGKRLGRGFAPDGLGDAVVQNHLDLVHGRQAQLENGQMNPCRAQLTGLVHVGDGQIFRAQFLQGPGGLHRAVAVGVRLHHAKEPGVRPHLLAQGAVVVGQGVQINLRPGAFQCTFHFLNFFRINWYVLRCKTYRDTIFIT